MRAFASVFISAFLHISLCTQSQHSVHRGSWI